MKKTEINLKPNGSCLLFVANSAIPIDNIKLLRESEQEKIAQSVLDAADKNWRILKSANPRAFNGELLNLKRARLQGNLLYIDANLTNYKTYAHLINQPDYCLFDKGIAVLGMSCILITKDKKIVLASRGKGLFGAGKLYCIPAGMFNNNYKNFEELIVSEAEEETGMTQNEISSIKFHGIGYDSIMKGAEFLFSLTTELTADEVIKKHSKAKDRTEALSLEHVPIKELAEYVKNNKLRLMDSAIANILAYLQHQESEKSVSGGTA